MPFYTKPLKELETIVKLAEARHWAAIWKQSAKEHREALIWYRTAYLILKKQGGKGNDITPG